MIKERKPWDTFPLADVGDDTDETTYAAAGKALSKWNEFEGALVHLFSCFIMRPGSFNGYSLAATRAFGAIHAFEGRIEMVREAGLAYFHELPHKETEAKFKNLITHGKGSCSRRNEIAHGIVRPYPFVEEEKIIATYALLPSWYDPKKTRMSGEMDFAYTSKHINQYGTGFLRLALSTHDITHHVIVSESPISA